MSLILAVNGVYHTYVHADHNSDNTSKKPIKRSSLAATGQYKKIQNDIKEHRKNIYAHHIMSKNIKSIAPDINIVMAMNLMLENKIHHLLVLQDGILQGIISDRDLLKNINFENNHKIKVKDIMTKEVLMCQEDTEIRLIAKSMLDKNISSLPVLNEEKEIKGIVTKTDLLNCIYHNMPFDIWV